MPKWAHPRSRGENVVLAVCGTRWPGSSPLTRGKRQPARLHDQLGGLIPAHAGKTMEARAASVKQRAHPRSRGENLARPDRTG